MCRCSRWRSSVVWPAPEMPRSLGNATWATAPLIASMQIGVMTSDGHDLTTWHDLTRLDDFRSEFSEQKPRNMFWKSVEVLKIFRKSQQNISGTRWNVFTHFVRIFNRHSTWDSWGGCSKSCGGGIRRSDRDKKWLADCRSFWTKYW